MADPISLLPQNRTHALPLANARLQRLVLNDLKAVCRQEGLTVSGKKADLQQRISRRFEDYLNSTSTDSFDLLYLRIHRPHDHIGTLHYLSSNHSINPVNSHSSPLSPARPFSMTRPLSSPIKFVESPFYRRISVLASFRLPTCASTRHDVAGPIPIPAPQLEELRNNSSIRVMAYCGEVHSTTPHGTHVKFPAQLEIRVNDGEVRANFKGVGKKEGSVKPVDITPFIRKQPGSPSNHFKITYALTTKVWDRFHNSKDKRRCTCHQSSSQVVSFLSSSVSYNLKLNCLLLTRFSTLSSCWSRNSHLSTSLNKYEAK
jgi:E3 SUMO-protein ligase PIAS1